MSFQIAQIPEESTNSTSNTTSTSNTFNTFNVTAKPQPQISGTYTVKCCENTWNIERNILLTPHPTLPKCGTCGKKVVYIKTCTGSFNKDGKNISCRRNFFQPNGAHNPYCPKCRPNYQQQKPAPKSETTTSQ